MHLYTFCDRGNDDVGQDFLFFLLLCSLIQEKLWTLFHIAWRHRNAHDFGCALQQMLD